MPARSDTVNGMSAAVADTPNSYALEYERERGKPMPSENHAIVQSNLILEFGQAREYRVMSELSLDLDGRLLTPDLSIYPRRPVNFRHDTVRVTETPLLVVEILSPTQGTLEVMEKVDAYLKAGVKSCWVINPPQRAVTIYTPDGEFKTFSEGVVKDPATNLEARLDAVFS